MIISKKQSGTSRYIPKEAVPFHLVRSVHQASIPPNSEDSQIEGLGREESRDRWLMSRGFRQTVTSGGLKHRLDHEDGGGSPIPMIAGSAGLEPAPLFASSVVDSPLRPRPLPL